VRFNTLQEWLDWQATLHPSEIELGLERVRRVWERLQPATFTPKVITVGGTNGKGSSVAFLESILRAGGYRVGCYTSPHLLRYNERIRIDGCEASDERICEAFEQVDKARAEVTLTYFEFGTLAALKLFSDVALDVVVLEVGLGGRLDAVNILDADAALITTIAIEHTEWLGESREQIALEKGGILRSGRPAVIGDRDPPWTLLEHAQKLGVRALRIEQDYGYRLQDGSWEWWGPQGELNALPMPTLRGEFQLQNAAAVLALLATLRDQLPITADAIRRGLQDTHVPGRYQKIENGRTIILDVAHNPQAAGSLSDNLREQAHQGRTLAVFSVLAGKNIGEIVTELKEQIDHWYLAPLADSRAAAVEEIMNEVQRAGVEPSKITRNESVSAALVQAEGDAEGRDRLLVFGSFITAAEALTAIGKD
jgi:dihydrofolate synthase/folylpolyglutamate synthase